ncbi:AraC family transcriptional regulator [Sandaracinus amylolyticus]|uniref:AraC family transcriptional regulator n=1 Tax=Sandaracinus amylolyticus TaxID=927083 RepID=UPI001F2F37E4|nr:AraC family transcriptional regulator [Sandaracinus amylolyticus]UJR86099.1 Hypothetical protein I5071_81800 [Sandaracinus amylolyticus]
MQAPDAHSIPAIHALHLADVVERWGIGADALLAGSGWTPDALAQPDARLGLADVEALVERARKLTGEPGIGFHVGLQMRIASHGFLGLAAMAAPTLGEAAQVAVRFAPTRTTALSLRLETGAEGAALVILEHADLGKARDAVVIALTVGIVQLARALTGGDAAYQVELAFDEPSYFRRFAHLLRSARFGSPVHRITFPATALSARLVTADPAALRLTLEQCERELAALRADDPFSGRVARVLPRANGGFLTIEEVAKALHVSTRTLKRRLAEEETSFRDLLEDARRARAFVLLRDELGLDEIAARLGYSDAANFSRAFRRWTGITPGAWRTREPK